MQILRKAKRFKTLAGSHVNRKHVAKTKNKFHYLLSHESVFWVGYEAGRTKHRPPCSIKKQKW